MKQAFYAASPFDLASESDDLYRNAVDSVIDQKDDYKDQEWCRTNFVKFLADGWDLTDDQQAEWSLGQLAARFTDQWADFRVIEGVDSSILKL